MSKRLTHPLIEQFINPSGLALALSIVLLAINAYASSQLLPLIRNIDNLNGRVATIENRIKDQELIIIPKGELDARFNSIETQLNDIKEALRK